MLTQHNTGTMPAWNEKNIVKTGCLNRSSAGVTHVRLDLTYLTPDSIDVTHVLCDVTPNASHVTPHVTHVTPDVTYVTPYVSNVRLVRPDVSNATHVTPNATYVKPDPAQEKCLPSDAAHILRQNSHPCLKVSSKVKDPFVSRHPFTVLLAGPTSCGKPPG